MSATGLRTDIREFFYTVAGGIKDNLGVLYPTQNRSYVHGLLFDRAGGIYRTEGLEFVVPRRSMPRSYRSRFYFDIYEKPERDLARRFLTRDSVVLELGACIGVVSCMVNSLLQDPTKHVVVEANPELIDVLTQNRNNNGCRFAIENTLVGNGETAAFRVGRLMTANRLGSRRGKVVELPMKTVAQLEASHHLKFDTLIADIEGAEMQFVAENTDLIARLKLVIMEIHDGILGPEKARRVRDLLRSGGLTFAAEQSKTEVWLRA
jgi:FkbM family methyltransferase